MFWWKIILIKQSLWLVDLTSNVHDTDDTLETVLRRIAAVEYTNRFQQEKLDTLRSTVTEQEQIIVDLPVNDNSTNDRVQVVEEELQVIDMVLQVGLKDLI